MIPKFFGEIGADGRVHLDPVYNSRMKIYLESFPPQTKVYVTVEKSNKKPKRSDAQNDYYWGVVVEISRQFCGYEKDEMHDAFGMLFRKMEAVIGVPTIRSTTSMSTDEFNEYVEQCRRFAAQELSLYIPDPNEVTSGKGGFQV